MLEIHSLRTSRREFLAASATGAFFPSSLKAQEKELAPLNRFPRMVQEYFVSRVRRLEQEANRRRDGLKTRADAEAYVREVREKIRQSLGPFPEKTPLNARVTGVVDRKVYRIEKVIFESRPGFLVTANLYIPKNRKGPFPGVVGSCGHSANGKAAEAYQAFSQGLARQGYVTLIFDPIGQGERLQYPDEHLHSKVGVGVQEHLLGGNQQFLVGEFFGSWRAWDGIRALDYLLSRPEVDPKHIGITGNSGGGTMTTWLCGVESRWTMAAPSCFVTTFRRNLENELPADTEQCPPRALALGLDHSEFLAALAPKPVIILAKEKDFFDVRGSQEAYQRLRRLYQLLGAEDQVGLFIGPTGHGYSQENREAMYGWFNKVTGISDSQKEPEIEIEKDETLQCTPQGQVSLLNSRAIFLFTRETSKKLNSNRRAIPLAELKNQLTNTLKLRVNVNTVPDYRILRPVANRKYPVPNVTVYAIETEPGIQTLTYRLSKEAHLSRPPRGGGDAILYVSHHSSDQELRREPLIRELIENNPNTTFFACDVRGIGESRPDTCGSNSFLTPYGADYFYAIHSIMLDTPYPGQKTNDILQVLNWISDQGHKNIHITAMGWGTIPATFAAILSDKVNKVTLKHAPISYAVIAEAEKYNWPLSCMVPGALQKFDLPNCYAALENKNLRQIEPWNEMAGK